MAARKEARAFLRHHLSTYFTGVLFAIASDEKLGTVDLKQLLLLLSFSDDMYKDMIELVIARLLDFKPGIAAALSDLGIREQEFLERLFNDVAWLGLAHVHMLSETDVALVALHNVRLTRMLAGRVDSLLEGSATSYDRMQARKTRFEKRKLSSWNRLFRTEIPSAELRELAQAKKPPPPPGPVPACLRPPVREQAQQPPPMRALLALPPPAVHQSFPSLPPNLPPNFGRF